jgi:hypothetical protein
MAINNNNYHGVNGPYVAIAAGLLPMEVMKHLTGFAPC